MTELPERIYVGKWPHGGRAWRETPAQFHITKEYLRDDTAIPRAEADAMVAAGYLDVASFLDEAANDWDEDGPSREADAIRAEALEIRRRTPADARAAFERAVQEAVEKDRALDERAVTEMRDDAVREAVEAERERCAAMVDAKGQQWWQRTSGDDFTATDMADLAAAIRAPQGPTE